ncbi:MAG: hypothetical protein HQ483_15515 [Rhodospirillales bacterium]|nr:hypothetical protein [Rhodospirillales bacterium]
MILLVSVVGFPAAASDGHDHGGGGAEVSVSPRVEARLDKFQVVLVYANRQQYVDRNFQFFGNQPITKFSEQRLAVFLENFLTGEPGTGATLEAVVNFLPEPLSEIAPGVYVSKNITLGGGRNEVELNYQIDGQEGMLPMTLVVPGGASSGAQSTSIVAPPVKFSDWLFILVVIFIYLGVTAVYLARRPIQQPKLHATQPTAVAVNSQS